MEKEILPVTRIIMEHQSKFESSTVVFTKHELFAHLCSRGYTIQLANMLTKAMDEAMIPRWTLSQWTGFFLSRAYKPYPSRVAGKYPIQIRRISGSVPILSQSQSNESVHISDLKVKFDNVRKESPHRVLLHFTTKRSAESIQKEGIDVSCGRHLSQFAVNGAFYLVDSVEFGLKWLRSRHRSQQGTVLVFEVPDAYFQRHRIAHLESGNDDWKKFCYANFNETSRIRKQQLEIDNDIIVGPICNFNATCNSSQRVDLATFEPFRDSNAIICMQHAILSQHAANELTRYHTKTWDIIVSLRK